jgi:hypothetical protein
VRSRILKFGQGAEHMEHQLATGGGAMDVPKILNSRILVKVLALESTYRR